MKLAIGEDVAVGKDDGGKHGWRPSFLAEPRHRFIPDTICQPDTGRRGPDLVPLHRDEHPTGG